MAAPTFRLITTWSVPAPASRAWQVLAGPGPTWPAWWPGLRTESAGIVAGPDGLSGAGSWVRLRVRSPVGASLGLRLDLLESRAPGPERPGRAKLRVSGDLRGGTVVSATARAGGRCEIRLTWIVTPMRGRPALVARVAPALCVRAHDRVMRAGERGLVRHLA
ncbi:hypothetical protein [Myceligenerans xiligouense]|uniref:Polyketide cyclase/dehydrase/lipid transport protein n=1 Tax=Myceligenerans xiligouense TaxID=253184 RepID=A0A3N4YKD9_9MICO|nr:hypothetical protein [Myceligenerans xiligouense]RPF20547.1 hypothetical protein EDD34_1143 [Myceligenerans xiligouense]